MPGPSTGQSVTSVAHVDGTEDNPPMNRENDLLPWILGGLLVASAAIAVTVVSTHRGAPQSLPAPIAAAASPPIQVPAPPATATPGSPPLPAPVTAMVPPAEPSAALDPVQPAGAPIASGSQIWECTTNGQKTFSDKPCGGNATLLEMNPLNVMNPTPRSPPSWSYPPESSNAPDDYYPDAQDAVSSSYPVVVGYPYAVHRRPEHTHRPNHPHSMPIARRN